MCYTPGYSMISVIMSIYIASLMLLTKAFAEDEYAFAASKRSPSPLQWPIFQQPRYEAVKRDQYFSIRHALESNADISASASRFLEGDNLPWACDCRYFWRDLGEGFFPRFVRDGACHHRTCWFGHFECISQKYEMTVLKQVEAGGLERPDFRNHQFGEDFTFTSINVTVNCMCGRAES